MRHGAVLGLALFASLLGACGGGGGDGPSGGVADFLHVTTSENTTGPRSVIDHPLANDSPDAVVLVTHNLNPGGASGGLRNAHPISAGYDETIGRWFIWNVDRDALAPGLYFNVTIARGLSSSWQHVANAGNLMGNATVLDHPELNGNAIALALLSKNPTNRGGSGLNVQEIGLQYDGSAWAVRLQTGGGVMIAGTVYNLYALPGDASSFLFRATSANISADYARFSHPDADGNPDAHVQVTLRNDAGVTLNIPVGVWYDFRSDRWAVFLENASPMPPDAMFVVRVK